MDRPSRRSCHGSRGAGILRCAGRLGGLALKRNVGLGGNGGGTFAEKLRQRGQRKGRWWSTDTRFPLAKGGYDVEQVDRWLERIDNLREKPRWVEEEVVVSPDLGV